ncbi:MAG: hypothetical protein O3B13_20265 [Planctomycetota bacterium]|nr:hypothetical protein [Planctomycetota bacterium]MDA1165439.1 hypothetical protein [Planctomycetota bacterium]
MSCVLPFADPVDAAAPAAGQGPNQPGSGFRQRRCERANAATMESGTENSAALPRKHNVTTDADQAGLCGSENGAEQGREDSEQSRDARRKDSGTRIR